MLLKRLLAQGMLWLRREASLGNGNPMGTQRKARARGRLKATFFDQLTETLEGVSGFMGETNDPDVFEALASEFDRLADTAAALHLVSLSTALGDAGRELRNPTGPMDSFVSQLMVRTGIRQRFTSIAIVATGPLHAQLERQIANVCEPVLLFKTVEDLRTHPERAGFQAEILPASMLTNDTEHRLVFAYGSSHDFQLRCHALTCGAAAYLPAPFRLSESLREVRRWDGYTKKGTFRLVFLHSEEGVDHTVKQILEQDDFDCFSTTEEYLFEILDDVKPDALLVAMDDSIQLQRLFQVLRDAASTRTLPIIGTYNGIMPAADRARCVHWMLDVSASDSEWRTLLQHRLQHMQRVRPSRDLWTGMVARSEVLHQLDQELARTRRSGNHLTVAIVEVIGVEEMSALAGPLVGEAGFRSVALFAQRALREFDVVGHLGRHSLLIVMPGCLIGQATLRLNRILERIAAFQTEIAEIAGMTTVMGLADTATSLTDLLKDAEERLRQARSRASQETSRF